MRYRVTLITKRTQERPVTMFTNSLPEAKRWADVIMKDDDFVEVFEVTEVLRETLRAKVRPEGVPLNQSLPAVPPGESPV